MQTNNILDANGVAIKVGSVVRKVGLPNKRGVVVQICEEGQLSMAAFSVVGDVVIAYEPSSYYVTNQYHDWEHIPKDEQTAGERYNAWLWTRLDQEEATFGSLSFFCRGIQALLPTKYVRECPMYNTEGALSVLACYIDDLKDEIRARDKAAIDICSSKK